MSIEPSDEDLLAGARAKDFGALYERTYPLIRAYLRRRALGAIVSQRSATGEA